MTGRETSKQRPDSSCNLPNPGACTSTMSEIDDIPDMPTLRAAIDAVDQELIRLFTRRHALIDRAAQIKAVQQLPARIDARVEEVGANAQRKATENG